MDKLEGKDYIKDIIEKGKEKIENGDKAYLEKQIDNKALAALCRFYRKTEKLIPRP